MIQTFDELITNSGPWWGEFGEYERVLNKEITNEECNILDQSSPQIQVLRCKLRNINCSKLKTNTHYLLHRDGKVETWLYEGIGKIDSSYCVFTRPSIIYEEKMNEEYKIEEGKLSRRKAYDPIAAVNELIADVESATLFDDYKNPYIYV